MTRLKKNVRLKSLDKQHQTRTRRDYIDYDEQYRKDLKANPEAEKFAAQFTDEYYGGAVHKTKDGRVKPGHLHKTKEMAKDCYKRNNDQNADLLNVAKANYLVSDIEAELQSRDGWYITNGELTEDALISQLEAKESEEYLTLEEFEKVRDQLTPEMLLFYLSLYDLE